MAKVPVGGHYIFQVSFFEADSGPIVEPDSLSFDVTLNSVSVLGTPAVFPGDIVQLSPGTYSYDWSVSDDAVLGVYDGTWTAVFDDNEVSGTEEVQVLSSIDVQLGSEALGSDYELVFSASINPMYIDPEELLPFFPDVSLAEIAEQIFYASEFTSAYVINGDLTPLILDYVQAATACSLSRIYDPLGMAGMSAGGDSVTLGDLAVKGGNFNTEFRKLSDVHRGNVTSWCELAALLRKELMRTKGTAGMKATRKASIYANPIPSRSLRRLEK